MFLEKGVIILLFINQVVTIQYCPCSDSWGRAFRIRNKNNCREYFTCNNGQAFKSNCNVDLAYNERLGVCDYTYLVDCNNYEGFQIPIPTAPGQNPVPKPTRQPAPVNNDIAPRMNVLAQDPTCSPTATVVHDGTACAGQTIFQDNFDTFREDYWQIEQYIPIFDPGYPFVSYQRLQEDPTVSVSGGHLRIAPRLLQNVRGYNNETIKYGKIEFDQNSGCTAPACTFESFGADILPPVVSGRLTSKKFTFTYGTVHVRAKLPQGDWLYPDLLLEPFMKKYGSESYASGVLRVAGARGNRHLVSELQDYSNKVLYGGPIMDSQCHDIFTWRGTRADGSMWGDDFHTYSLRWAPDGITLSVDGFEWARVEPGPSGLNTKVSRKCHNPPNPLLAMGTRMAPFDVHFKLTLGLGAGGVSEFPDDTRSGIHSKPWKNKGRKAVLNFWEHMTAWTSTWNNPELLIDSVKVVAL